MKIPYNYVVVEGSGGITCPLGYDEEPIQLEDIVRRLGLPSLMVADAGLEAEKLAALFD